MKLKSYTCGLLEILQRVGWMVAIIYLSLTPFNLPAQQFRHISLEQGLSHGSVYAIAQDTRGVMWFGTEDGINMYDGYTVTTLHYDPTQPNALSSNDFSKIWIDASGIMWLGTWGGGLNRYDPSNRTFTHYRYDAQDPHSLSQDRIEFLLRDSRGVLWVGTDSQGLNRLDEASGHFIHYRYHPAHPSGISHDSIKTIFEDRNGQVWFGTNAGLDRYDPVGNCFIHYHHEPGNPASLSHDAVRSMCQGDNGVIWVGTRGGGLNRFDPQTGQFKSYTHDHSNPNSISDNDLAVVFQDSNRTLWIGTYNGGLNRFDPESETFTRFEHNPQDSTSISHNRVEVIYEDRGKVLWLGTRGGGVNWLDLKSIKFKNYLFDPHNKEGLPYSSVPVIAPQPGREVIWLGTDGDGLYQFDTATGKFKKLRGDPPYPDSINNARIRALLQDKQGNLWVGTYMEGLIKMILLGPGKYRPLVHQFDPKNPTGISADRIHIVFQDQDDDIWVGTEEGLNLLLPGSPPEQLKFKPFRIKEHEQGFMSGNYINTMYQDLHGRIWVGTAKGLFSLEKANGQFTRYAHDPKNPNSLSHDNVYVIVETSRVADTGVLWIGTEDGLNKFSPTSGTFTHYTITRGLSAARIMGILADADGNLWIGSSQGLSRFDPVTGTTRHYGVSHGLHNIGFYHNACLQLERAGMFFSSVDGLVHFFPRQVKDNPFVPTILLTAVKSFNRDIPLAKPLWAYKEIGLSYKENFISFEFAALDYTNPANNRFAYKLDGIDPDWIDSGTRHYASYPKLSPGDYIFRVRGTNNDGIWNYNGVALKVTIIPPWWGTWWFRMLGVGIFVLLVFASYHSRVQHIKRRNTELSDSNARLEEQMKKRQEAEEALLESRERLSSVLRHASIIIWVLDKEGVFTLADGRGLAALGVKPEELVGKSIFEQYAAYPDILSISSKALLGEIAVSSVSIGNVAFELRYTPLVNRQGELTGTIGVAIDETERKRAEAEKSVLEEQLRHVQKLETIGTLAGGIAHDFNNILGPILGYTEMALEEIPRDSIAVKWLENVVLASHRARDLVQQILVFGRREKQEYKPVLIQRVIREALKLIRASLPATIDIHQDISDNCGPVLADPSQIHQVFMNLCINAKHAMQENGGTLTVQLRMARVNEIFAELYPHLRPGAYVRLTMIDTGHGMDEVTLRRLFEPFYTTKKPGEGSGMGLSVVHGIVLGHGGEITVSSLLGVGSEFNVYLPVVDSQSEEELLQPNGVLRGNEHILLVDDEESMTVMAGLKLKQMGYQVTSFTDPVAALNYFKENPGLFHLVMADQTMPKMTGVRLAGEIKTLQPDLPVIIVSGFSEIVNQENFHQFGVSAYISKPFNTASLGRTIRKALEKIN